jgi:nicotinate-nucleotide adenylyltransferase
MLMIEKTIAIFGGSFDPPHIGHEAVVLKTLQELNDIDKLIVVPAYLSPFKSDSFLNSYDRFALVKKLFNDLDIVDICDYEIKQQKSVYTIDTVKYLKDKYHAKKIYLIIGADNIEKFHLWHKYDELIELIDLVVVSRTNYTYDCDTIKVDVDVSSTQLRQELDLDLIPKKIQKEVKRIWNKE